MAKPVFVSDLCASDKEYIQDTLECNNTEVFDVVDNVLYLPFSFAFKTFVLEPDPLIHTEKLLFTGTLRNEQLRIKNFVIDHGGTAIVSAQPGFGKTITAIAVACELGVKTVVIVNKIVLLNQWIQALCGFAPSAVVQVVKSRDLVLNPNASVYIVNAVNVVKHNHEFWKCVKFVIVDELHQIITNKLCIGLLRFVPVAILGLSATPYRHDDFHNAIEWFFGTDTIGSTLWHRHRYRVVETHWTPRNISYTPRGLDWNKILEEQSLDNERNELIAKECISEVENGATVLILVKRIAQAKILKRLIGTRVVEPVATLVGSAKLFDKNCKVLIGTTSKIGVGFDYAPINCLIVAADVKQYFVQFLGRCMRTINVIPVIVDFRDSFNTLEKHLNARIDVYRECGGTTC